MEAIDSPLKICLEDNLCVGVGAEVVAISLQGLTNLTKIVYLPVVSDMHLSVITGHGLTACVGKIKD